MKLTAPEYINYMEKQGLYTADEPVPELNAAVWREYLRLYDQYIDNSTNIAVTLILDRYGFFNDPLDEKQTWTWALAAHIPHVHVPFSKEEIIRDAPAICDALWQETGNNPSILTDTFEFPSGPQIGDGATDPHFIWVNSPVVSIPATFDEYVTSLKSDRRSLLKRNFRFYEDSRYNFRTERDLSEAELVFAIENMKRRWGEDAPYAIVQFLWAAAVYNILPQQSFFPKAYDQDRLILIKAGILKGDVMHLQSAARDETGSYNSLNTVSDYNLIRDLCGSAILYVDPNCRCATDDPPGIVEPKRAIINTNAVRPILCIGLPQAVPVEGLTVPYADPAGWHVAEPPCLLGKAA